MSDIGAENTREIPKALLGRALMLLDSFPKWSEGNMEYAVSGTAAWMAEAKNVLEALADA